MNSALKPVLPGAPQASTGAQASPAKGNVAAPNHSVALPQGANSLHNNLVGQNLSHHAAAAPPPPHPAPSMAPVSANMAQMAQNMSHHGNLSHVTQNSVAPPNVPASPNKPPATSAPLSLVQDKPQPLALTRTPEKKESESAGHANGTLESPKSVSNAPAALKPLNPETNKDKQDIAKTSPSTPKPPEKATCAPSTPQKPEPAVPVAQAETQPKVATANEAPEKSPSKPSEPKLAPTADVAPPQSDSKPVPESANGGQLPEVPPIPQKAEAAPSVSAKTESPAKPEEKKEEPKVEKPALPQNAVEEKKEEVKVDKVEPPKKEQPAEKQEKEQKPQKLEEKEKPEEKKPEPKLETKTPTKAETKATPRSTLKLATVTPAMRKRRQASPKAQEGPTPSKKLADGDSTPDAKSKRNRTKVQLYQSPTPELAMATKLSASAGRATPPRPSDDKLIVFYKNEYLAVRNADGGFYVCQATQNVYRTTRKIKIRWLSQDKAADHSGETYKPDFYDVTDMECVLTTLSLIRAPSGGGAQLLKPAEAARAKSILERALRAEQSGGTSLHLTEEHPDGLDLSLYKDESQLEKKSRKRGAKLSPRKEPSDVTKETASPVKKARPAPKRSPIAPKARASPKAPLKRQSAGSTPTVASTRKTATAVTEKTKAKSSPSTPAKRTPPKRTPAKRTPARQKEPVPTPTREGRRTAAKEAKPSPAPIPSTSTGKATRTPRKPPAKK